MCRCMCDIKISASHGCAVLSAALYTTIELYLEGLTWRNSPAKRPDSAIWQAFGDSAVLSGIADLECLEYKYLSGIS